MSKTEKEIRLKINKNDIEMIKKITKCFKKRERMIDITCGKYGFDSLKKLGYIGRIRYSSEYLKIEIKKYENKNQALEKSIKINSIKDGLEFFELLDMYPYLVLDRYREIRKFNDLLIFIDEFETIGSYLEIEYENKLDAIEFINMIGIECIEQEKYGDIYKNKIDNDPKFEKNVSIELDKLKNKHK
ncbi:MAG: CYTH domain-containing protein [Mycoplasmatota bacterium]|nr:CYTH domain-containing protein [Mycoplasmatota bacterium]